MQEAIFEGVAYSMGQSENKLFVSIEGGYGKSVILAALAHQRLASIQASSDKTQIVYILTPTTYLQKAFIDTFTGWFDNYESGPVYITAISGVDTSRASIVLIDEADVFLF